MSEPVYQDCGITLYCGDALDTLRGLPDGIVQCCVTSPPYWGLRNYGHEGQIGLEESPDVYVTRLVDVFGEVRRVLRDDGVLWLNLGDSYLGGGRGGNPDNSPHQKQGTNKGSLIPPTKIPAGFKAKDLAGIPWLVAFALRADGWYLRSDIIWAKRNVMPESVTDRPTRSHEYIFLMTKSERYYYDHEAIREDCVGDYEDRYKYDFGGYKQKALKEGDNPRALEGPREYDSKRNKRDVWSISTKPYHEAHFAVYPEALVEPCILAGSAIGDIVLDPFNGSGTTGAVAERLGRKYIGIELNPEYIPLTIQRLAQPGLFATAATESSAPPQTVQQEMFRSDET